MMKWIGLILLFCSCSLGAKPAAAAKNTQEEAKDTSALALPAISDSIKTQDGRAEFLALHYFDAYFNYTGTNLPDSAQLEQAQVNYLSILPYASEEARKKAIQHLFDNIEKSRTDSIHNWIDFFDHYLYDPHSPMCNEESYIPVLHSILQSSSLDNAEKEKYRFRLNMAMKNRVGKQAADFTLYLHNGSSTTVKDLLDHTFTLLFFNNPNCTECKQVKQSIIENPEWKMWSTTGYVKIVAIYTDEDVAEWKAAQYPNWWINGYDKQFITKNSLYDLKASPTIYLLDKGGKIILKNTDINTVYRLLKNNETKG